MRDAYEVIAVVSILALLLTLALFAWSCFVLAYWLETHTPVRFARDPL